MLNELAGKYAQAILELAQEKGQLGEVEEQLKQVVEAIEKNSELKVFMNHPRVPAAAKKSMASNLFTAQINDYVLNFLLLVLDRRREALLKQMVEQYTALANEIRNIVVAEVTTAQALSNEQLQALQNKLAQVTGKSVTLQVVVDPAILGGLIVKIGDKLIDGSVSRQLAVLKTVLLSNEVTKIGVTN